MHFDYVIKMNFTLPTNQKCNVPSGRY